MILQQYGITYKRLTIDNIELVRYWRNQKFIADTMQFKTYITPSMQTEWFKSINNPNNYFFIIEVDGKKIGLINSKDYNTTTQIAEGGIFIWDKEFWDSPIPAFASLTILQASFDLFDIGLGSFAKIITTNETALNYNLMLGYQNQGKTEDGVFYNLFLSRERYESHCKKIIKAANTLYKNNAELKCIGVVNETQSQKINDYLKQIH